MTYIAKDSQRCRQKRQCKGGGTMAWLMIMPNGLNTRAGIFRCSTFILGAPSISKDNIEVSFEIALLLATCSRPFTDFN